MAMSIHIDSIALHSIKRGIFDSITFKYDETKVDKPESLFVQKMFTHIFTTLLSLLSQSLDVI
jgi:hypothetical protein